VIARIVPVAVGLAWGLLVFWIALVLSFPSDAVRDRISWEVDRATGGAMALKLEGIRPSWSITGALLEDMQLLSVPMPKKNAKEDDEPALATLLLAAARVNARLRVLPLLGGDLLADLHADLYQGTLSGELGQIEQMLIADLVAKDLDLSLYPFEGDDWSVDVHGLLDLVVDMTVDPEEVKEAKGDLELDIEGLILQNLTVFGFTIDEAVFNEAVLKLDVHDGEAEIKKGSFLADMVEATLDGKIMLSSPLERSRLKLTLKVRLDDDLDSLAKLAPGMKNARDDGGTYHFMVSGSVEKPRFREDRLAARKRKGGAGNATPRDRDEGDRAGSRPPLRAGTPDADADERRRLREERIAERRDRMRENRDQQLDGEPAPGPDRQRGDPPADFEEDFEDRRPRVQDPRDDEEFLDDDIPREEDLPDDDLDFEDGARELGYQD
jgi:type II secretion system protein N